MSRLHENDANDVDEAIERMMEIQNRMADKIAKLNERRERDSFYSDSSESKWPPLRHREGQDPVSGDWETPS